jgi:hypothetical protein
VWRDHALKKATPESVPWRSVQEDVLRVCALQEVVREQIVTRVNGDMTTREAFGRVEILSNRVAPVPVSA